MLGRVDTENLRRVIEDSGIDFKVNARSYVFSCPRCGKKDKLVMFKDDGRFVCWVCADLNGFRGRPEYALTEMMGMSLPDLRKVLYRDAAETAPLDYLSLNFVEAYGEDEEVPAEAEGKGRPVSWPLDFYAIDHDHARKGREYLASRDISMELAMQYGLRYCPVQQRVVFPIYSGGKLRGWQARAIFKTEWWDEEEERIRKVPKILTTGRRESVLMFEDHLAGSEHAILCEGPVDAIKCHLAGGNVASMGKIVSRQQIQLIRNSGVRRVYLGLDRDAATETMKLLEAFDDLEVYRLLPAPGYDDLGAMPIEAVPEQLYRAERIQRGQLFMHLAC
jgi:hypothetical protein